MKALPWKFAREHRCILDEDNILIAKDVFLQDGDLLAAAPDLQDALQQAHDVLNILIYIVPVHQWPGNMQDLLERCYKALRKAEGR